MPVDAGDPEAVFALAEREQADLTVIGPELPLTRGVADLFAARGRLLLGPTRLAAELESSKAFAKDFMARHGVPTARYQVCESPEIALAVLATRQFGYPGGHQGRRPRRRQGRRRRRRPAERQPGHPRR